MNASRPTPPPPIKRSIRDECRDVAAKLRRLSPGVVVYRIENPEDGSYCEQFTYLDCVDPYGMACKCLENLNKTGAFVGWVVASKRIHHEADRAMQEAAELLDRLTR